MPQDKLVLDGEMSLDRWRKLGYLPLTDQGTVGGAAVRVGGRIFLVLGDRPPLGVKVVRVGRPPRAKPGTRCTVVIELGFCKADATTQSFTLALEPGTLVKLSKKHGLRSKK